MSISGPAGEAVLWGPTDPQWGHHMVQEIGGKTSEKVTLCSKEIPRNNFEVSLGDLAQRRVVCRNTAEVHRACFFLKPRQGVSWI